MRRADRLFQIIQLLRRRRTTMTAADLAARLEVSERTIYRDVRDLVASGTPIQGEAGVGYTLHREYDLPPLMFDEDEIEALVLGARLVAAHGDPKLARAAMSLIGKVEAVLPKGLEARLRDSALYAPRRSTDAETSEALALMRTALATSCKVTFDYEDVEGRASRRTIQPLGAFFWGRAWTVAAWCELRDGFRNFRVDRIRDPVIGPSFEPERGRTLRDFMRQYGEEAVALLDR